MTAMAYLWLAAAVGLGILEASTFNLVSIWFVGGAVAAFFAAVFGGTIYVQLVLFVAISAILLAALRPLAKKRAQVRPTPTNADRLLGTVAVVTERIDNVAATGAVKAGGMEWTARSESEQIIEIGAHVKILRISGVKVYVELVEAPISVPVGV